MSSLTEALTSLRKIVGNEPKEQDLIALLQRCNMDANAAANAYFDGGVAGPDPFPSMIQGVPVAEPVQAPSPVVAVTCPPGVGAGDDLQVQTEAGLLKVQVPAGVTAGAQFLVRLPGGARPPAAPAIAAPGFQGCYSGAMQPPQQPQQQGAYGGAYPGAAQMPPRVMVQQQPAVHVVHASPYYGGYGYGYGDPFLAGTMGFMGGMLIADAMFW